ncbi:MAG: YwiC-like family protein [Lentisphaerae bacterium]|nr:YwiC-like family protein [Lentisphaerota bacterium]
MTSTKAPRSTGRGKKKRHKGISPWVPNQHGAWAMLVSPAVLGLVSGLVTWNREAEAGWTPAVVFPAVLVAWFFGYFAFFAFGLAAKARNPRRRAHYLTPVYVYGTVALAGIAVALLLQPALIWWAVPFAPLVAVAVWETIQGRSRSTLSGVSTTIASALLFPVLTMVGQGESASTPLSVPDMAWTSGLFLAIYFSGTIPFVKSMIREKGNRPYLAGSIAYHVAAVSLVLVGISFSGVGWGAGCLMALTMTLALARAVLIPRSANRGGAWPARRVGMAEVPILLAACLAVLLAV